MPKGQNIAGYGVGILHFDEVWHPLMPGNAVNAWTYDFPVRYRAVEGLSRSFLREHQEESYNLILDAARKLEKEGVRVIAAPGDGFGYFQKRLSNDMDIPVALSSLIQIPLIRGIINEQKIAVITSDSSFIDSKTLNACGIMKYDNLIIEELKHESFYSPVLEESGVFDNEDLRRAIVNIAEKLVYRHPDIGAILLENGDLPPYASDIQRETGRPVFDMVTLIEWLNSSVMQKPYGGWI